MSWKMNFRAPKRPGLTFLIAQRSALVSSALHLTRCLAPPGLRSLSGGAAQKAFPLSMTGRGVPWGHVMDTKCDESLRMSAKETQEAIFSSSKEDPLARLVCPGAGVAFDSARRALKIWSLAFLHPKARCVLEHPG